MGNFLQQLQNNEAVLLMYLADELPVEDRAEVEQLLSNDARLRIELQQIQEAQSAVQRGLRSLDQSRALPVSADVAVRHVSRMMKQRQLEKMVVNPTSVVRTKHNLPWWMYLSGSIAAAVVATVVIWGLKPVASSRDSIAIMSSADDSQPPVSNEVHLDPAQEEQARLLDMTLQNGDELGQIANAETEATTLARDEDSDQILSMGLMSAAHAQQN